MPESQSRLRLKEKEGVEHGHKGTEPYPSDDTAEG